MTKKIIVIAGATGAQGGGLARAILADPTSPFAVRALTRDVNTPKARALAALGAEVVAADVDDRASLNTAFAGAYGAYCVTFFGDHFSPEREKAQAENMALAAKEAGLQHVIWSTLEDTRKFIPLDDTRMPTLMGRYKVPHFDAKAEADHFFVDAGVPTTFLLAAFYWENFIHFGQGPARGADGGLALSLPMADVPMAGIASEDIGRCALGIFRQRERFLGKTVGVASEQLTGEEMAAAFADALGEPVTYRPMTPAFYRGLGFPGAEDMGNMYQFYAECEAYLRTARDPAISRELNPGILTFRQWLAKHAAAIPNIA